MPAPRKHILFLSTFSEYVYRLMMSATANQKAQLSESDLKHFKNENAINHFAKSESLDRLLLMVTQLNKDWALLVYPDEDIAQQLIFNTFNQNQFLQKRRDVIEVMKKEQVYAVSSREAMVNVQMMAQNAHTEVYHLSDHMKELIKKNRQFASIPGYDETVAKATEAFGSMSRLILEVFNSTDHRSSALDITDIEMRILLSLFDKRNGTSDLISIAEGTRLNNKRNYLKTHINKLISKGLIISDAPHVKSKNRKILYLITTKGEKVAMEYVKHIFERSNFK